MQGNPFAPTTITAADIQKVNDRIDALETTILTRIDALEKKILPVLQVQSQIQTTSSLLPTTGLSNIIPTPSIPTDLSNLFPKQGGSRRKTMRKKLRKPRRARK